MHIVHGTWIPDNSRDFIQNGAFYLWVETDTRQGPARRGDIAIHPRHLSQNDLATFLLENLGMQEILFRHPGAYLADEILSAPHSRGQTFTCF